MKTMLRATCALVLLSAATSAVQAQIPGMPLFTNPKFTSGFRIHADAGMDLGNEAVTFSSAQVFQGGVSFAAGIVGLGLNVGATKNDLENVQDCVGAPVTCESQTKVTGSALLQLRLVGGGQQNGALSVFGGVSSDFSGYDSPEFQSYCADNGGFINQATCDSLAVKVLTLPVGVSVGFKLGPMTVWGAPRYVMFKAVNCSANVTSLCETNGGDFRWAVGANLPLFSIVSLRAAYDSGKIEDQVVNRLGVGVTIGLGGVH